MEKLEIIECFEPDYGEYNNYVITHNKIDEKKAIPVTDKIRKEFPVKFRLFDDDGIHYFSGRMQQELFGPLDTIGASYGCTELQSFNEKTGEWETL